MAGYLTRNEFDRFCNDPEWAGGTYYGKHPDVKVILRWEPTTETYFWMVRGKNNVVIEKGQSQDPEHLAPVVARHVGDLDDTTWARAL